MSNDAEYAFTLDPKSALEAMTLSGARAFRGRGRMIWFALLFVRSVLVPIGAAGFFALGFSLVFGEVPRGAFWMPVAILVGGVLGIWINRASQMRIASLSANAEFGRSGRISVGQNGVVMRTSASEWSTGWQDIDDILLGKRSIGFCVAGIVLILPLSSFANKEEMQSEYAAFKALRAQVRGPQ